MVWSLKNLNFSRDIFTFLSPGNVTGLAFAALAALWSDFRFKVTDLISGVTSNKLKVLNSTEN